MKKQLDQKEIEFFVNSISDNLKRMVMHTKELQIVNTMMVAITKEIVCTIIKLNHQYAKNVLYITCIDTFEKYRFTHDDGRYFNKKIEDKYRNIDELIINDYLDDVFNIINNHLCENSEVN